VSLLPSEGGKETTSGAARSVSKRGFEARLEEGVNDRKDLGEEDISVAMEDLSTSSSSTIRGAREHQPLKRFRRPHLFLSFPAEAGEGASQVQVGERRPIARPPKVLDTEGQIYAKAVQLDLRMGEEMFRITMGEFVLATAMEGEMGGGVKLRSAEELWERLGMAEARIAAIEYYNLLKENLKKGVVKKGVVKKIIEAVGVNPRFLKVRLGRRENNF